MAFFIQPQVHTQEVDLTTSVSGAASSVAVIVLRNTYKGSEMTQQYITSIDQLIETFGQPRTKIFDDTGNYVNTADCFQDLNAAMGYLKYGQSLYCTRVMSPSATFAGVEVADDGTYSQFDPGLTLNTETITGDIEEPDDFPEEVGTMLASAGDDIWIMAKDRGYWGNNTRVALIDKTTQNEIQSDESGDWDSAISSIVNSIDNSIQNDYDFLLIVQNKEQGSNIYETVEIHNVSLYEGARDDTGQNRFVENVINSNSEYIRIAISEDYIYNDEDDLSTANVPTDWVTNEFRQLGGGSDHNNDNIEDATIIEGYDLYKKSEEIDVNIFIDSNKSETVKRRLVEICQDIRKDAMAICDVNRSHVIKNKGSEATDIVKWRKGLSDDTNFNQNSSYVTTFGNWFNIYDKYLKQYVWVPVSGHIAGLFAKTDSEADPWFAPAGLNRAIITGVRKLAWNPDEGERALLYKNGINPITSFAGQGKVVWGQKTMLDQSSAFNRINVRRLFLVLEKSISTSAKYFLFEPNDRFTRIQLESMINPFLEDVQSRRGITGFYTQIDEENNTPARIDRNELWASIFIKPTRAAEYVILQFVATPTGANFDELIGSV